MKAITASSFVLASCLAFASAGVAQEQGRTEFPRLTGDPKTFLPTVLGGRFALEMRRAGGPRPDVLLGFLEDPPLPDGNMWMRLALAACDQDRVPCQELLSAFDRLRAASGTSALVFRPDDRELLEKRVARQRLSTEERTDLYRRALSEGSPLEWRGVYESGRDAARRVYNEKIVQLYPLADSYLDAHADWEMDSARAARRVASAAASPHSLAALVALVREVAAWDVGAWAMADDQRRHTQYVGTSSRRQLLERTLTELRMLELPGTATALKEVMSLFREAELVKASPELGRLLTHPQPPRVWFKDEFSLAIAEAIGDLGDRDTERAVFGGRCLFDMVSEGEKAMVAAGMMEANQMVTGDAR
ncbi:MAG TPA: hypothetical protein VMT19_09565 [Thermoanaerobaculaceae bacterium]|nr:hypothetical protein [Thermoanaerobaculaceae bacterium]